MCEARTRCSRCASTTRSTTRRTSDDPSRPSGRVRDACRRDGPRAPESRFAVWPSWPSGRRRSRSRLFSNGRFPQLSPRARARQHGTLARRLTRQSRRSRARRRCSCTALSFVGVSAYARWQHACSESSVHQTRGGCHNRPDPTGRRLLMTALVLRAGRAKRPQRRHSTGLDSALHAPPSEELQHTPSANATCRRWSPPPGAWPGATAQQ